MIKNILKNTSWMLLDKVSRLVIGVIITSLIARHLGPQEFGKFNLFLSLLTITTVLSSLGLNRIIIREITTRLSKYDEVSIVVSTAFFLRVGTSFIIWTLLVGLSFLFYEGSSLYIAITTLSLFFLSADVFDFYSQATERFKAISLCRTLSFLISSSVKLMLVYFEADVPLFLSAVVLDYFVVSILFYLYIKGKVTVSFNKFKIQETKRMLSESWPEIIAGFSSVLFMKVDHFLLQYFLGSNSVGIYTAATRITESWYFIPATITAVTFPKLVKLREKSNDNYLRGIRLLTSGLVVFAMITSLLFVICSPYIIDILYGEQYDQSVEIMIIHTWGGIFLCMGIASGSWLAAEKRLKLNLIRNVFGLLVCICSNFILIPIYGPKGAAYSTVIGMAAAFYLFDIFLPELRGMFWLKTRSIFSVNEIYSFLKGYK